MPSAAGLVHHRRFVRAARVWAAFNTLLLLALGAATAVLLVVAVAEAARAWDPSALFGAALLALMGLVLWGSLAAVRKGLAAVRGPESDSERHWLVAARHLRWSIGRNLVLGASALALTSFAILATGPRADRLAVAATVCDATFLFLLLIDCFSTSSLLRDVCVVPYFESKVGEIETFARGRTIARRLNELDDRARALGLVPLSEFGWNDDLAGEPLIWRNPADGLTTVDALLAEHRAGPAADPESIDDLERLAHALKRADDKRIRFCLLLRHGDATSGLEWERRKGTCF